MIVFDLRCSGGHVFEAWFGSGDAYEKQRRAGQLACPLCGDGTVEKALMAPAIAGQDRSPPPPAAIKDAMRQLAAAQASVLAKSEWVGDGFARRARAMHDGDEPRAVIHGHASIAEARSLIADGVPVAPLPLPVTPPDRLN